MEAGLEHLGRATARAVSAILAVVEPDRRSLATAHQVRRLAGEIGIERVSLVANKIRSEEELDFVRENAGDLPLAAHLPFEPGVRDADREGVPVFDAVPELLKGAAAIAEHVEESA